MTKKPERFVYLDIETTGLDVAHDRIIEISALRNIESLHSRLNNAGVAIHEEASAVHGIKEADLVDAPEFSAIAPKLVGMMTGAKVVAHNAPFVIAFLNAELERAGIQPINRRRVVDTLTMARAKYPTGSNSLDALCSRYGVPMAAAGDGREAFCKRLRFVHHHLRKSPLESDVTAIHGLISRNVETQREMWKRIVRIEEKLDTLLAAIQPKGSTASA